jgi:hypothetical protein
MDTKALSPRELFDGTICYEIPPFQRPYVWNEEDQWQPLWTDIERVASAVEDARNGQGDVAPPSLVRSSSSSSRLRRGIRLVTQ